MSLHSSSYSTQLRLAAFFSYNQAFILILWWLSQTQEQTVAPQLALSGRRFEEATLSCEHLPIHACKTISTGVIWHNLVQSMNLKRPWTSFNDTKAWAREKRSFEKVHVKSVLLRKGKKGILCVWKAGLWLNVNGSWIESQLKRLIGWIEQKSFWVL